MRIRIAKTEDYQELMNLYNYFVKEDRYSKLDNDSFFVVLNNNVNYIFVAEDQKKLIGFGTFSVRRVVRYSKVIAELDELFVLSGYRNKGVATEIMNVILNKARELNCYRMYIESAYNHKEAHKFYEKLAFKNYGYHFVKNL